MDKLRDAEEMREEMDVDVRARIAPWKWPNIDDCDTCAWDKVSSSAVYRTKDLNVTSTSRTPDIIVFDLQDAVLGKRAVWDFEHIHLKGAIACTIRLNQTPIPYLQIDLSIDPGEDITSSDGHSDPSSPVERATALERFARENIREQLGKYNPYTGIDPNTIPLSFTTTNKQDNITFQGATSAGANITSGGGTYAYRLVALFAGWESPHPHWNRHGKR